MSEELYSGMIGDLEVSLTPDDDGWNVDVNRHPDDDSKEQVCGLNYGDQNHAVTAYQAAVAILEAVTPPETADGTS